MRYYPALDGIRAIAIVMVLMLHGSYGHLPGGFLGVDMFFVLSGYLITRVLIEKHALRLGEFYLRRVLRLSPALMLMLALAGATWHLGAPRSDFGFAALSVVLYVSNFVAMLGTEDLGTLVHTWSLATEEQFYLLWPLSLWLLTQRMGARSIVRPLLLVIVAVVLLKAGLHQAGSIAAHYFSPLCRIDQLLIGCVLALSPPAVVALQRHGRVVAGALVALLPVALILADQTHTAYYMGGMTLFALGAASLIAVAIDDAPSRLRSLLSLPPLVAIGRVSYGLYLFHPPIFTALEGLRTPGDVLNLAWVSAARLALTGLAAYASFTLVEQPILRMRASAPARETGGP